MAFYCYPLMPDELKCRIWRFAIEEEISGGGRPSRLLGLLDGAYDEQVEKRNFSHINFCWDPNLDDLDAEMNMFRSVFFSQRRRRYLSAVHYKLKIDFSKLQRIINGPIASHRGDWRRRTDGFYRVLTGLFQSLETWNENEIKSPLSLDFKIEIKNEPDYVQAGRGFVVVLDGEFRTLPSLDIIGGLQLLLPEEVHLPPHQLLDIYRKLPYLKEASLPGKPYCCPADSAFWSANQGQSVRTIQAEPRPENLPRVLFNNLNVPNALRLISSSKYQLTSSPLHSRPSSTYRTGDDLSYPASYFSPRP